MRHPWHNLLCFTFFFVVPFCLYLMTMAPGITEGDAAELIGVAHGLGVAHLGYPLFALLGKAACLGIPIGSLAYRINVLCALLISLTTLIIGFLLSKQMGIQLPSLSLVMFLPILGQIWEQGTASEVYALQICLTCLWLYILIMGPDRCGSYRRQFLLFFIFALALASHHYTILLVLVALLSRLGRTDSTSSEHRLDRGAGAVVMVTGFLIGASIFLYIPVRADQGGSWNWNYANSMTGMLELLSAHSFQGKVMYSLTGPDLGQRCLDYLVQIYGDCGFLMVFLAMFGIIRAWQSFQKVFFTTVGFFLVDILYCLFLNEAPLEVTPFGLMSRVCIIMLVVLGFDWFYERFPMFNSRLAKVLLLSLLVIIWSVSVSRGLVSQDVSADGVAADFVNNVATTLPEPAILICEKDEIFPLMYAQTAEHLFSEVVILHYLNFPRANEWYTRYLTDRYPEFNYFREEAGFQVESEESIIKMVCGVGLPVWMTFKLEGYVDREFTQVQSGLLFHLDRTGNRPVFDLQSLNRYRLAGLERRQTPLGDKYIALYHELGKYYLGQGFPELTRVSWLKALEIDPEHYPLLNNLGYLALQKGQPCESLHFFEKCLEVQPDKSGIQDRVAELRRKCLDR
ncbi:DUF2723 domain-containing protein [bacterium]|nr:DUF2723 domain-containing protein [bacterium]